MKQFDAQEQHWILQICQIGESDNAVLTNVFADVLSNKGVAINLDSGDLLYDWEKYKELNNIISIQKIIIKRALLIKYLEEHHYIYIINDSPESILRIGDKFETPIVQKLPTEIADILRRTMYRIYVDSTLRAFISQSFKTTDEITIEEAQKQTKSAKVQTNLAWGALACSIITILLSLTLPRCSDDDLYHDEVLRQIGCTNTIIKESFHNLDAHADSLVTIGNIVVLHTDSIINLEHSNLKATNKTNRVLQSLKKSMLQLDKKQ